jgi:hypothetical protein
MILVIVAGVTAFRTTISYERGVESCVGDFVEPRARVHFVAEAEDPQEDFSAYLYKSDSWAGKRVEAAEPRTGTDVTFTVWSEEGGVYVACVVVKRSQDLTVELVHGTEAVEAAAMEKHSHTPVTTSRALDDTHMMLYEYRRALHQSRTNEERIREGHERSVTRLIGCCCLNAMLVIAVGVYQMNHMRSFFRSKKII